MGFLLSLGMTVVAVKKTAIILPEFVAKPYFWTRNSKLET